MSQWVTANTCARLGSGSKEYELVVSLVSEYEDRFFYQRPSPEHPLVYYLQGR
jgi:hypothetical protein